jgi:Mg2+-importing ATPase
MTADSVPERKFWQLAITDLEKQLATGRDGLSTAEAASRRVRYGPNSLEERRHLSLPLEFFGRFRNPLVLILLVAAGISALTGDLTSFIIICTIVVTSALLDTVQEYRAKEAAESLKVSVALKEHVLRDGQEVTVLGQDLVPGDVVLLAAGDLVPADGRLLEARDFFVNEALLTGESYPAEKHARDEGGETPESCQCDKRCLHGQLCDERFGRTFGLRHRPDNSARSDQQQLAAGAAAFCNGSWHPPVRHADRPFYHGPRTIRFAGQFAVPPALAR